MKTCSGCPRRPAVTAHHARARKGPCGGLPRWKTSRSRRSRRIDVPRRTRDQATGKRARLGADPYPAPNKRCQRVRIDRGTFGRKSLGTSSSRTQRVRRTAARCRGRTRWSTNPKPATRRQARSCRRSDDRKVVRRRSKPEGESPRQKAVSRSNVGGFPTALDGQSPKEVFLTGARDVNVGCRNGFEASWQPRPRNAARRYEARRPAK